MKEILEFIELEDRRLREKYGDYPDSEKRNLARTVKLTEEVGELCSEVLSSSKLQRQEKLDGHGKQELENEFADVVITTLLLAKSMDVDIELALKNKIEKINKRYEAKV
jgi:NTP pyrophosphatase (non-canonical NTP hydrolase)